MPAISIFFFFNCLGGYRLSLRCKAASWGLQLPRCHIARTIISATLRGRRVKKAWRLRSSSWLCLGSGVGWTGSCCDCRIRLWNGLWNFAAYLTVKENGKHVLFAIVLELGSNGNICVGFFTSLICMARSVFKALHIHCYNNPHKSSGILTARIGDLWLKGRGLSKATCWDGAEFPGRYSILVESCMTSLSPSLSTIPPCFLILSDKLECWGRS